MEKENKNESNKPIDLSNALDNVGSLRDRQERGNKFFSEDSRLTGWITKYSAGFIKDKHQAAYVLMVFVVLIVIATLFLLFGGDSSQPTSGTIPLDQFVP